MRVDIKALAKRLTKTASSALERAVKDASDKGHAEVTIDHVVLQLLLVQDEDAERLLEAAASSRAEARHETLVALSRLKSGASERPSFSDALWPWIEGACLLAAVELAQHRVRSGALLWAAARHAEGLDHPAGGLAPLAALDAAAIREALVKSPESSESFDLDELEALGQAAREERVAEGRGELEREREEELRAAEKAAAEGQAHAALEEAARAEARAKEAAAEAAKKAWSAAEAAAAAKAKARAAVEAIEGGDEEE